MTRTEPCDRAWCPFLACATCGWKGGDPQGALLDWKCQACGKPAPPGDAVCTSCGEQNRRSKPTRNEEMVYDVARQNENGPGWRANASHSGASPRHILGRDRD